MVQLNAMKGSGPMKIKELRTTEVGTPWRELTCLELLTDEGLTGLAEARIINKTDTLLARVNELGARYVHLGPKEINIHAYNG